MTIDDDLKDYLEEHLQPTEYQNLLMMCCENDPYLVSGGTFLMILSTKQLSSNILASIKQFLENLSTEVAEYIAECDDLDNSVIHVWKSVHFAQIIIEYVHNINALNRLEENALVNACATQPFDLELINLLLDHKINVNAQDNTCKTALMYCCITIEYDNHVEANFEDAVELLIFNGADVHITDFKNETAYDYVSNKQTLSEKMSQLLQGTIKMNRTKAAIKN